MNTYEIIAIVALVVFILLGLVGMTYIIVRLCQSSETKSNDGDDAIQGVMVVLMTVAMAVFGFFSMANQRNIASHKVATHQLAKSYQTAHSDEMPITLNLDNNARTDALLPDTLAKDKVTKVFYTNSNGAVVSGDKSDYRKALKSDNPVYVFVKQ